MPPVAEREAPTEDQPLVSQPDKSALFMARRSDLRLVMESIRTIRDAEGVAVDKTAGKTLAFKEGVLRVPLEPKAEVMFTNGEIGVAEDVLRFLRKHRFIGDLQEGFWEIDPVAPPPALDELDRLQRFALELDVEGLQRFVDEESAGWARSDLLEVAQGTLERVQAKHLELEQRVADAHQKGRLEAFAEAGKANPDKPAGKPKGS